MHTTNKVRKEKQQVWSSSSPVHREGNPYNRHCWITAGTSNGTGKTRRAATVSY